MQKIPALRLAKSAYPIRMIRTQTAKAEN